MNALVSLVPVSHHISVILNKPVDDFVDYNVQLRVSSEISNAPVILNVDCDMYSNNSNAIQDALCFFMDEERSHEIAFVQFPQSFGNATKNEVYGSLRVIDEVSTLYISIWFYGVDEYSLLKFSYRYCYVNVRWNSTVLMVTEALCILELAAFIGETHFTVESIARKLGLI